MELVVTGYAGLYGSLRICRDAHCGAVLRARYAETFLQELLEEGAKAERLSVLMHGAAQAAEKNAQLRQSKEEPACARIQISAQETAPQETGLQGAGAEESAVQLASDECIAGEADALAAFSFNYARAAADGLLCTAGDGGIFAAMWKLLKAHRTGAVFSQRSIPILQQTVEVCETFGMNPYRLSAPGCAVWLSSEAGALLDTAHAAGVAAAVIGYVRKGAGILRTDGPQVAYLRRPEPDELQKLYDGRLGTSKERRDQAINRAGSESAKGERSGARAQAGKDRAAQN